MQVYHLKRYKNVEHASGKTRRFNIFKVLCDHFESPLSPGEFTLDQGLPTQNFWNIWSSWMGARKPSSQRIILKKLDWLMRRSKQNCLKNCRKLRNDYYVIIVGEAFCWKSSLRCGFRDTYWKIILQENISKCHLLQWSKDFGWF